MLPAIEIEVTADTRQAEAGLDRVAMATRQVNASALPAAGGMARLGQTFQRNSFAISNAANQFSDLAVQIGAGVPASRALSQQLPQVTAMMGPMATIVGVASGVLIGLAGSFLAARVGAGKFDEAVTALEESTRDLRDELFMAQRGLDNMAQVAALREIERVQQNILDLQQELETASNRDARNIRATIALEQERLALLQSQLAENQQLAEEVDRANDAFSAITDLSMDSINAQVAALAAELGIAADEALRLLNNMPVGTTYGDTGALLGQDVSSLLFGGQEGDIPAGRGGGGGGAANPIEAALESLRESLMGAEQAQLDSYARQQETLASALEQRLITQQEYNELMEAAQREHQEAMAGIDVYRYGTGLQQAETFFGDMASAMQGGTDQMQRIARSFGAIESLINAYRAFNQVLADPTLPFFAKIPAAASVLAAGMNAVNAIKGGGGGGGAASGGGMAAAQSQAARPTQTFVFDMVNATPSQMSTAQALIDMMNEARREGFDLEGIVRG